MRTPLSRSAIGYLSSLLLLLSYAPANGKTIVPTAASWRGKISRAFESDLVLSEQVTTVQCDNEGLIWFGTTRGLYVYTGQQTKRIPIRQFESIEVIDIETESDKIWFLTPRGLGLMQTNWSEPLFYPFEPTSQPQVVTGLSLGTSGRAWISTEIALLSFDSNTQDYKTIPGPIRRKGRLRFSGVLADKKKSSRVWVTDRSAGYHLWNTDTKQWNSFSIDNQDVETRGTTTITQHSNGDVWVGGVHHLIQIVSESLDRKVYDLALHGPAYPKGLISSLKVDEDGTRIWIGTTHQSGLLCLNTTKQTLEEFGGTMRFHGSRKPFDITDIEIDQAGSLWMATRSDGLVNANRFSFRYSLYEYKEGETNSLHGRIPERAMPIGGQSILIQSDRGISQIDEEKSDVFQVSPPSNPASKGILDTIQLGDGTVLGLFQNGIKKLNYSTDTRIGEWDNLLSFASPSKTPLNSYFCQEPDGHGHIWFSRGSAIYCLDTQSINISQKTSLDGWIYDLHLDGVYLWGIARSSVFRWNHENGKLNRIDFSESSTPIKLLVDDTNRKVWVGTTNGLASIEKSNFHQQQVTGVKSHIESLCLSKNGNLWVASGGHLRLVDTTSGRLIQFPAQSDFDENDYTVRSILRGSDDTLLLGSWNKLMSVDEQSLLAKFAGRPRLMMTSAVFHRRENTEDGNESEATVLPGDSNQIVFSPSVYAAELHFSLIDYRAPKGDRFQYRFGEGKWIDAPGGMVRITRRPPGNYVMNVRATASHGQTAENNLSLSIKMLAPIWQRPWFIAMIIGALFVLGYIIAYLRFRLIRQAKRELELANAALQRSKRQYRRIFMCSTDAIVLLDDANNITDLNPAAGKLLKTQHTEAVGQSLFRFTMTTESAEKLLGRARQGERISNHPLRMINSDGDIIRTLFSATSNRDEELRIHIRDVTKEALLENQMKHAQKMEAVGTLAGGISHDFNNLLSPIILHSQMARQDLSERGEEALPLIQESLATCEEAATKAAGLVQDLLTFARTAEDGQKVNDLSELCRSSMRLIRGSIASSIRLRIDLPEEPALIRCSARRFEQALTNLVVNASHAIGANTGTISVSLRRMVHDWVFVVQDTGCGMDKETMKRIFEPFFTTKKAGKGTGLGLAMVQGFVEESGGKISITSNPGEGTAFTLRFPEATADPREEVHDPKFETAADSSEAHHERVLLVDDDPMVLKATSMILSKKGYEVDAFNSPEEAAEQFGRHSGRYDAVVTDQMMPRMTGIDFASRIVEIRQEIPVVLLTGYSDELQRPTRGQPIRAVHVKPLDFSQLHETLQRLIHEDESESPVILPS